ncbi:hypothetical protein [Telmatospirillum siberiense]|uniref:Sulfotransferase n=1 Tax=Telmatospirillum siberiense TaxID=382514 RepID=A0A2N3PUH3_9PROT|nr:hypothetical protein [Telmatospirillum siberiense]PKU24053.1 hypothetical protein CWS72_13205 [Telmatospirillum siberiense]
MAPTPARFVIFAAPRTGSNLLCSLLNAHPDILCHHGLFNPLGIHGARNGRDWSGVLGTVADRNSHPRAFLRRVWAAVERERAVGFKMNRGEDAFAVDELLRDDRVRKILLKRRNRVRTYVSEILAQLTGFWESYGEPDGAPLPVIHVDPLALRRHADKNATYYAALESVLSATGQAWLETHYESLGDRSEIGRILSFLQVPAGPPLRAACHKRGPSDLETVVANMIDLADALRDTPLFGDLHQRDMSDLHLPQPTP